MTFNPRLVLAAAGFALAHFGLPEARRYGEAWDDTARPVMVEAESGGQKVRGALHRVERDRYEVRSGGQTLMSFRGAEPVTVTYGQVKDDGFPAAWRRYLPFVLVAGLALALCVPTLRMLVRRFSGAARSGGDGAA